MPSKGDNTRTGQPDLFSIPVRPAPSAPVISTAVPTPNAAPSSISATAPAPAITSAAIAAPIVPVPASGNNSGGSGGNGGARRGSGGGGSSNSQNVSLHEEARRRYLNYALSVITSRALPDVRDGLKPVQRRILYGMFSDQRLTFDAKYMKCAKVTGNVMGNYHPHGNTAIYEALARMAQDFSLRYPLVDGHGNFGSLDGDAPAAERYTECRLTELASALVAELNRDTVEYRPTYDGTMVEPVVLPAQLPQLLMNGSTGIAVGMATNIPPHNVGELIAACAALIDDPSLDNKGLLKFIKGPDFPTGGQVLNSKSELLDIYETGGGSIRVRGEYKLEDLPRGGQQIIITSIPYMVNKSTMVAKFGELVRERKIPLITDVRDESTKDVRVVLELKRDANPELVMAYLYKQTTLQSTFGVNLTCLVPTANPEVGTPLKLDLKSILGHFVNFRFGILTKRLSYDLAQLEKRLHVLEGFEKVYDALDEMLKIIRKSEGKADASEKLQRRFSIDSEQSDAILELRLFKLARLEILVIQKELEEKRADAKRLQRLLGSDKLRWNTVKSELETAGAKYADKRRTKIGGVGEEIEFNPDAFIADEDAHVVLTRDGWVKRVREIKDPNQTRLREGDAVTYVLAGSLRSNLVIFSNFGTAYVTRFNDVPASTGYGDPVQKLFKFDDGERVVGALSLDARLPQAQTLLAISKQGLSLRFGIDAHKETSTRSGRRFARPPEGDELVDVFPVSDEEGGAGQLVGIVSERGHAIVFHLNEVNELSGPGRGVQAIKLDEGDRVIAIKVAPEARGDHAVISLESEKGKKVELELRKSEVVARGGKGRELVRKDKLEAPPRPIVFVPLPSATPVML
jgi:DNA gyrase subunit A